MVVNVFHYLSYIWLERILSHSSGGHVMRTVFEISIFAKYVILLVVVVVEVLL